LSAGPASFTIRAMKRLIVFGSFATMIGGALASSNCGGGAPSPAAPAGSANASAAACFALAGVKRERNPNEPSKVSVRHVLVQYTGAKNARPPVSRTRDEACLRALQARDELRAGADFVEVVKKYSDEPGAASRSGSLGSVERKDVAPPFADAAFELRTKEFSDVVESDFGFHVIMRME
jgi:NIMA-interacting peptidyl-prolyl cis-trans isomerase 1